MLRRIGSLLLVLSFSAALAGCGDTWRGVKQDTGENMEATGDAIEDAGEKLKE